MNEELNGLKKHFWLVALTVVLALVTQSFTAVWWASSLSTRINYMERDLTNCGQRLHAVELGYRPLPRPDP